MTILWSLIKEIVGMFLATWLAALLIWRYGRVEEKWGARLRPAASDATPPDVA